MHMYVLPTARTNSSALSLGKKWGWFTILANRMNLFCMHMIAEICLDVGLLPAGILLVVSD
jgi:hypothetical protein